LKELSELTQKYGLVIESCGCCNGPWLRDLHKDKVVARLIMFDKEKQKYEKFEFSK
jgi:Zn-finger nucleic acid-binding protein